MEMSKVDKHISELLYDHDCVIIPNFGGFLANYSSAKIHAVQHLFSPPSKHIVFNKNLKNNDGLLANQIATVENINYTAALEQINSFVAEVNTTLKSGKKAKIDSIGTLSLDVERNIQFQPFKTNFLTDAFGLTEFQSPAIKQDNISKKIETGLKKEFTKVIDINASALTKRKINYKRAIAVAAVIPLIGGILWISIKTDLLNAINYSNLNPFASKHEVNDTIVIYTDGKSKTAIVSEIKSKTGVLVNANAVEPVTPALMEEEAETIAKADTTFVAKAAETPVNMRYHVVTGCFQMEENAKKFVSILQKQNVEGTIIGKNNKGLYMVSSGDFVSKAEAVKGLRELQKQQHNAWLFESN